MTNGKAILFAQTRQGQWERNEFYEVEQAGEWRLKGSHFPWLACGTTMITLMFCSYKIEMSTYINIEEVIGWWAFL